MTIPHSKAVVHHLMFTSLHIPVKMGPLDSLKIGAKGLFNPHGLWGVYEGFCAIKDGGYIEINGLFAFDAKALEFSLAPEKNSAVLSRWKS